MVHRRQTGPSCGGGRNRPAYHIPAGSLQPTTYGSGPGPRNNGWNGRGNSNPRHYNQNQNRTHDFLPHQPVHFDAPSPVSYPPPVFELQYANNILQVQPQGNFRQGQGQGYNRRPKNPLFQTQQGGGFNAPNHAHQASQFQRNARSVSPVSTQFLSNLAFENQANQEITDSISGWLRRPSERTFPYRSKEPETAQSPKPSRYSPSTIHPINRD